MSKKIQGKVTVYTFHGDTSGVDVTAIQLTGYSHSEIIDAIYTDRTDSNYVKPKGRPVYGCPGCYRVPSHRGAA